MPFTTIMFLINEMRQKYLAKLIRSQNLEIQPLQLLIKQ